MRQREAEERLRRILGTRFDEGITAELTYPEELDSKRKEEETMSEIEKSCKEQADEILLEAMKHIQQDLEKETALPFMAEAARTLSMLAEAMSHNDA